MKKMFVLGALALSVTLFSCRNSILKSADSKNTQTNTSIKRYVLDSGKYTDVTLKNVDAALIDSSYFDEITSCNYRSPQCTLNFDKALHRIHVTIEKSDMKGFEDRKIECTFKYEIKSAGKNVVYICPSSGNDSCFIDGEEYSLKALPSFMFYIPLYGFGENRLEVSSILKDENAVGCQTLWAY